MAELTTHPVQAIGVSRISTAITLRAYEVYAHVHGPQRELIEGGCRGGFSNGELIAFLYARSFPREEWRDRADEAFYGMESNRG